MENIQIQIKCMRISRKKRPAKSLLPIYYMNDRIRAPQVRVIDAVENNLGVMTTAEALERARAAELDLVEINPKASPPVCKLVDFTHFKYQREKELKKQKAKSHVSDTKGVRLSVRIGDHDLEVRKQQSENFLNRGDKIKPEIILRGRENARPALAFEVMERFYRLLATAVPIKYEQTPTKQANKITAIIVKTGTVGADEVDKED